MLDHFIQKSLLPFVFIRSSQPILFVDMLKALKLRADGMLIGDDKLGFRLKLSRSYMAYIVLIHIIIIPATGIFHSLFIKLDCHFSIILTMFGTAMFFALYLGFREWLYDTMADYQIRRAWKLHMPLFSFEENHERVAQIYTQALKEEIGKKDIQMYVLDRLTEV